ncbi:MAG TPA: hypothetical protein VFA46_12120 [Actinomycetes bacterium]|nr:hypothetical protein [Actinomycetes bacterium]
MRQEQYGPGPDPGPGRPTQATPPGPPSSVGPVDRGLSDGTRPLSELDDRMWSPEPEHRASGAYWTGVLFLAAGLIATIAGLATHVTSIVQTVLLAIPLVAIGIGLERIGRSAARGSLRALGGALVVIAVASPIVLAVSSPGGGFSSTVSAPVPAGTNQALLRVSEGGGQLRIDQGAIGLYDAELRSPGRPAAEVSTSGKVAVVDLRSPAQRGLLARNRGSDWGLRLNSGMPWRIQAEAAALTGDLDLRRLDVRRLDLEAGISRLAIRLNQPSVQVPVNIRISTGLVDVYLPASSACQVRVEGPALNNFSSVGFTEQNGVWRTGDPERNDSFKIDVHLAGGRVRVHRF